MKLPLKTERLILRYFDESDTAGLFAYRSRQKIEWH